MLQIGIVGKKRYENYCTAIKNLGCYTFSGVFDPSFQFEAPGNISEEYIYYSFSELVEASQALVFSSAEKIYLPLIELALKNSKPVFLHGVHNLSLEEQKGLLKLHDESREVVQIQQPFLFNAEYINKLNYKTTPLLWQFSYANNKAPNLLMQIRSMIAATIPNINSNIRKTAVSLMASCSEVPDIYNVRLDFDNGAVAEITANNVEPEREVVIKCFELNKFTKLNLIDSDNSLRGNEEQFTKSLRIQLDNFYFNISNFKSPISSIENEICTQQIVELVKQKLRININIF